MNWYSKINLIKLAAAKSKIQRYGIANPSVKFFIHSYEELIPWEKVEQIKKSGGNAESYIQQFISSSLLSSLGGKINSKSDNSNFMKADSISNDDAIQELRMTEEAQGRTPRNIYSDEIIQQARSQILDDINKEKANQFNSWWQYMKEEETYAQNPAFQYSILKPIIDSSSSDKKNSSPPLNAEILAGIWEEINDKGVDHMNILKKYRKLIGEAEKERAKKEGVKETEKGGSWIRIKGGPSVSSPEELKKNINRLKNLSQGTGWCTARGKADEYLPKGDFYLYLENDKAVVAIRCVGNKVVEIRGYNNDPKELDPYWQEVINFLSTTNLDYKNNSHYKSLQDIYLMNIDLEQGSPEYNTVLGQIKSDHKTYLKLSDENKRKFPEFAQTASIGYRKELDDILTEIENPSIKEDQYLFKFDSFQEKYNKIPLEIKNILGDMKKRVVQVHKTAYYNNPLLFPEFSAGIQSQFSEQEQKNGWMNYINLDPYHYNDNRMPDNIRKQVPIDSLKARFEGLLKKNSEHIDYIPTEILSLWPPGTIEKYVINDFEKYPVSRAFGKLDKLERMEKLVSQGRITHQQIVDILSNSIRQNPKWINVLPKNYQKELMSGGGNVGTIVLEEKKNHIIRDVGYFKTLTPLEQNEVLQQYGAEIGASFAKTVSTHFGLMHNFWNSVPESVRPYLPYDIIDATATYYANIINSKPANKENLLQKIPSDILPFVFTKIASRKNWYKKAQLYKEADMKNLFLGFSVPLIAFLLGLSISEVNKKIEENPQQLKQEIQLIQQQETSQQKEQIQKNESFNYNEVAQMIERHEGKRNKVYLDTMGIPTIGIGFNLNRYDAMNRLKGLGLDYNKVRNGQQYLTDKQIYSLFKEDLQEAIQSAMSFLPNFQEHSAKVQSVIIDMAFNLGSYRLKQFKNFREALINKDYQTASNEMINSKWYGQVGNRSIELKNIIRKE